MGIKGRHYKAGPVDFISKAYSFTMFYFLIQRYSETIPLKEGRGDRLIFNYLRDEVLEGGANIITRL
jgi:hypothetical protein